MQDQGKGKGGGMWIIAGVIVGLIVGNLASDLLRLLVGGHGMSFSFGLLGALAGGLLGAQFGAGRRAAAGNGNARDAQGDRLNDRVHKLEQQVDWLYRESQALRRELGELRGVDAPAGAESGAMAERGADVASATEPGGGLAPPAGVSAGGDEGLAAAGCAGQSSSSAQFAQPAQPAPALGAAAERRMDSTAAQAVAPTQPADDEALATPTAAAGDRGDLDLPGLWARLTGGNPLAKVGVVLLFFGVASALRLAAEYGLMPVPLRLFLAAAGGVGLIAFGLRKAEDAQRRTFGLAIQGGGFALLYLVVYFMLARYAMLGAAAAFALFAVLGVACVVFAARQDGPLLAVFGLAGAFLAPVLAGGRADSPLGLFSYFALLNAFILVVDWRRAWCVLNIAGFLLTLVIGMAWAIDGYRPAHYLVTQSFLVLFLLMYSATPVAAALLRAPGFAGWRHGMLVFGVPLAGAFLQSRLMHGVPYGLAWSALFASIYYFALWALLFRRRDPEAVLVERSHLGLAIAFFTVSVPLAFGAQVTSAFWAAEGAAVLWFGTRQRRTLAQATGLGMQALAGLALLHGWDELVVARPLFNDAVLGGTLLAAAGIASARLLRALGAAAGVPPAAPFVWALAWWLATGLGEIDRFAWPAHHAAYGLLFVTATVLLIETLAVVWRWPQARRAAVLHVPALALAIGLAVSRDDHPLGGLMLIALPLGYLVHGWLLLRHLPDAEAADRGLLVGARHAAGWWLALLAIPLELGWLAGRLAPGSALWPALSWGLVCAASLLLVAEVHRRRWPRLSSPALATRPGAVVPAAALTVWSVLASLMVSGDGAGLPYLPIVNPVDLVQLFAMYALWRLGEAFAGWRQTMRPVLLGVGFVWLSTLPGRIVHHLWGVPFDWWLLWDRGAFQALLTLLWTVTAIAVMIRAGRQSGDRTVAAVAARGDPAGGAGARDETAGRAAADRRRHWFAGFALLVVVGAKMLTVDAVGAGTLAWTATLLGVAVLVLAAGYFAPLPPPVAAATPADGEARG